jgi:albonoursin synthase
MSADADVVLRAIRSRRVVRSYAPEPVAADSLAAILDAARWALNGGNRRLLAFQTLADGPRLRLVKSVSPGMLGLPPAVILVCIDLDKAASQGVQLDKHRTAWIDVGTALMNMSLAAHVLGLGSCPVTSFSRSGLRAVLELPAHLQPELILQVGHPAPSS